MEENLSENYEDLLNKINKILVKSNKLNNKDERVEFFKQNEAIFGVFKNKVYDIANEYLVKESDNVEQNKISNLLRKVILQFLNSEEVFNKQKNMADCGIIVVDILCHYENRLIFRLRHTEDVKMIFECLEYQKDREAYIRAIKHNKSITDDYYTQKTMKNYVNYSYEKILFENLIRIIKDEQIVIKKNKYKTLINRIDSLEFMNSILKKEEEKQQTDEKWILQRYADTIIPLKANEYPEALERDKLVTAFLNGKIKNETLYLQIANAIPIEEFEGLIFAINMKSTTRMIREIKLGNLSDEEKIEINRLLEKAGIEVNKGKEEPEDDENYLVTLEELKEYYEKANIEDIYNAKARFYKANISENNGKKELSVSERKAYKEISIVIRMMTKKIRNKISPKFIEFIERNKNTKAKTDLDKNKKLQGQKLRYETKIFLAIIYRDYICSAEERKKLIKKEEMVMGKKEKEKHERSLILLEELKWYQKVIALIKKAMNTRSKN